MGAGRSQLRGAGRTTGSLLAGELCVGENSRGGGERLARREGRMCAGRRPGGGIKTNNLNHKIKSFDEHRMVVATALCLWRGGQGQECGKGMINRPSPTATVR